MVSLSPAATIGKRGYPECTRGGVTWAGVTVGVNVSEATGERCDALSSNRHTHQVGPLLGRVGPGRVGAGLHGTNEAPGTPHGGLRTGRCKTSP